MRHFEGVGVVLAESDLGDDVEALVDGEGDYHFFQTFFQRVWKFPTSLEKFGKKFEMFFPKFCPSIVMPLYIALYFQHV